MEFELRAIKTDRDCMELESEVLSPDYFQMVPNILVNDLKTRKLRLLDIAVYMVFSHFEGKNQRCWPTNKRVAMLVGTSIRNVARCIGRLQAAGHIKREGKSKDWTRYTYLSTQVKKGKVIKGEDTLQMQNEMPPVHKLNSPGGVGDEEEGDPFEEIPTKDWRDELEENEQKTDEEQEIPF